MHQLSNATVKLISSSQVITSVYAAVKELVENSIDAKASSIEIRLDNYGLKGVQVVDNGCGIPEGEEEFVAKPHFTSKLKDHSDLASLSTYGFRGEALNSLCCISNLSFSTKTENQSVGTLYNLDRNGNIVDKKPCTRQNGVTMICDNLFKNLPVRKQFYSGSKKGKEELKKIQDLLLAFGLIMPELRITLKHNHSVIWQKLKFSSLKDTFISVFGVSCYKYMQQGSFKCKNYDLRVTYILPKISASEEICRKTSDRIFVSINRRPVVLKDIYLVIKSCCNEFVPVLQSRYPIAVLAIDLPPSYVDVNVEPNKSVVLMENMDEVKELIMQNIFSFYKEQSLSMEDPSICNSMDMVGHELSSKDHVPSNGLDETEQIQNEEVGQNKDVYENEDIGRVENLGSHSRSSRKCEENSHSFIGTSPDSLLDFSEEAHNSLAPRIICKKQFLYSEIFDEAAMEGEKSSKVPRLELEVDEDNLMLEELPHEKSDGFQNVEESVFDTCAHNPNPKSPQNYELISCVKDQSALLLSHVTEENFARPHIVDNSVVCSEEGRNNINRIELDLIEDQQLGDGKIAKSCNVTVRDDSSSAISNASWDKVENAVKARIGNVPGRSHGNETFSSARQLTVDEWSRGIAMADKDDGEPFQPFRILQPVKSCVTKKRIANRRTDRENPGIKSTKSGFVQSALYTEPSTEYVIQFNLNDIKHHLENHRLCDIESTTNKKVVDVIGQISPWNSWIIKLRNELYFFNPFRAYEGELLDEMMKKHIIPSDLLQKAILITESFMKKCSVHGSRNWEFLQSMPFERSMVTNERILADDRIASNGIEIRKRKDLSSNEMIFEIVKISGEIKDYGVSDLNEILDKIHEVSGKEKMSSFEQYRPEKVVTYFQRESTRLVRSSTIPLTKDEINSRVLKIMSLSDQYGSILCLHGKPILSHINTVSQ